MGERRTMEAYEAAKKQKPCVDASDQDEFVGQIIDIFEDFLEVRGIEVHIPEKDGEEDGNPQNHVIIYGSDYDDLAHSIRQMLVSWLDVPGFCQAKKKLNLGAQQLEDMQDELIYRKVNMRYLMQDAEEQLVDCLETEDKAEILDKIGFSDWESATVYLARMFEKRQDCDIAENITWAELINRVVENRRAMLQAV
jgi:hypothetical protein